jgi:deazaflavin-dependent oxidoreductase (nitroreductase family)
LNEPQFLYLTTVGWKTGKQHKIEIWYVKQNRKYYIMSELGESAHWVRNIRHSSRVSFTVNCFDFDGDARIVHPMMESRLAAAISELMKVKYKWNQGLAVELTPLNFGDEKLNS